MKFTCEHIGLAALDPTALREWYTKVLGARTLMVLSEKPPAWLLELPGGARVEIYQADFAMRLTCDNTLRGWRHMALRVSNLDEARAELEARGVKFFEEEKPAGGGGRVIFFNDPDGNLFHLVERPDGFEID